MKALILAAGYGTRLLPYTKTTPKTLFTFSGRPLLDTIICNLVDAGCQSIIINTHHLYQQLDSFLACQSYSIPVMTRYEPEILGTAGAIKNVADFWDNTPFMVINSDVITDINLKDVYDIHISHDHPITLVLHNDEAFNTVCLDKNGFVSGFHPKTPLSPPAHSLPVDPKQSQRKEAKMLTYTGIQVLDPEILDFIPDHVFSSCIDLYKTLLSDQRKIYAFISESYYWKDIGTPERYKESVFKIMAPEAFEIAFPDWVNKKINRKKLKGDGSDRSWYRLTTGNQTLVMVDHGIRMQKAANETDAFIAIGNHLFAKGIPVPRIFLHDAFSGLAFLEDLGDLNLQTLILNTKNADKILSYYQSVIHHLIKLFIKGNEGFDPTWTYQTTMYNQEVILEKECRYFVDAFLNSYLGADKHFIDYAHEFTIIAKKAVELSVYGFMHRDVQSRNIMVKNSRFYFIDFQGGRRGPIQYDLASLLIDPYVALPRSIQDKLIEYCIKTLSTVMTIEPKRFLLGYAYCALTRNLQILGAFGYLSRTKGKKYFEKYIPRAIETLMHALYSFENNEFPKLTLTVENIYLKQEV